MRASTLFVLTLALLVGLGVAVAARTAGWFGRTPEPPAKKPEIQVLVAARNVFAGDVIESNWVRTRPLKTEETPHFESHKDQDLPAVPQAAALRVARKNIEADAPILRENLQELAKPIALNQRLLPNMRAVNVGIPKDQSAGGLIQIGEWVDVLLTSQIEGEDKASTTRTAAIAHKLRVISKRNALWNIFAALPDDKPVQFILEANPYRASLIEYSKNKGNLSLEPVSAAEQASLEEQRNHLLQLNGDLVPVVFRGEDTLGDYEGEESRIHALSRGSYTVSHADLVRIFDLKTPPPPLNQVKVEQFSGLHRTGVSRYSSDGASESPGRRNSGGAVNTAASDPAAPTGFRFSAPDCASSGGKSCKSCGSKKH